MRQRDISNSILYMSLYTDILNAKTSLFWTLAAASTLEFLRAACLFDLGFLIVDSFYTACHSRNSILVIPAMLVGGNPVALASLRMKTDHIFYFSFWLSWYWVIF